MDFLDPCGICVVRLSVAPWGAEPLWVCLVNRHERGLFQEEFGPERKSAPGEAC